VDNYTCTREDYELLTNDILNISTVPAVITELDDIIWVCIILGVDDHVYQ